MRIVRRVRPILEPLENRLCPTGLTVRLISSTLYIQGDSVTRIINLNQNALTGQIQVLDNTLNLGSYTASNISLRTGNAPETVNLTLANNRTLSGNVSLTTGNGADQIFVNGNTFGEIAGNLTINTGGGANQASLGTTSGLIVGGNVTFLGSGNDTFTIQGGSSFTSIAGNVIATDPTGSFQLGGSGDGALVAGSVTINGTESHNVTVTDNASVGQDFQSSTGGGLNQVTINGSIGGNVNVTETGTASNLNMGLVAAVGGSLTYAGSGTNTVNLTPASFAPAPFTAGDVTLNLGDGDSNYSIGSTVNINGNLRVNAGNGTNVGTILGTINGNQSSNVGNGDDTLTVANAPGGVLSWTSGNGNSAVQLGFSAFTTGPETWNLNTRFGTGNDTLALSGAVTPTQLLTGFVDMGGPAGANTFDPAHALGVNWQVLAPFTLQNV